MLLLASVLCMGAVCSASPDPRPVLAAYPNWGMCDDRVATAIENGVNTVIWFQVNLVSRDGRPHVDPGSLDLACVASVAAAARRNGSAVAHYISIGGWNAPHPDAQFTGAEWYQAWVAWNAAAKAPGFDGFAGFDWDLEGHDDPDHPNNYFTDGVLEIMKTMSLLARGDGLKVAMAPAQSYLDAATGDFSQSVSHPPVEPWHQEFRYHGRNVYAYLLAACGVDTFDFVSLQLYEGFSGAGYHLTEGESAEAYLVDLVERYTRGWTVHFDQVPHLGLAAQAVAVPADRLVLGFGNAWATPPPITGDKKFVFIGADDIRAAWSALRAGGVAVRGFMWWALVHEGESVDGRPVVFSEQLNFIVRP
ncbi:hypothetical protein DIPPA_03098 [Diplonema papillatum]|nr:hypothetical protein DIPPA_03098 [Diplonema papillatum]